MCDSGHVSHSLVLILLTILSMLLEDQMQSCKQKRFVEVFSIWNVHSLMAGAVPYLSHFHRAWHVSRAQ